MPQRKGETGRAYMDRLRAARGLTPLDPRADMMEQVRAAKCYLGTWRGDFRPGMELTAFMHIFHPDHPTTHSDALRLTAHEMDREARVRRA